MERNNRGMGGGGWGGQTGEEEKCLKVVESDECLNPSTSFSNQTSTRVELQILSVVNWSTDLISVSWSSWGQTPFPSIRWWNHWQRSICCSSQPITNRCSSIMSPWTQTPLTFDTPAVCFSAITFPWRHGEVLSVTAASPVAVTNHYSTTLKPECH